MYYHGLAGQTMQWDEPLEAPLQSFWESMVRAYREELDYHLMERQVYSAANPLLAPTEVMITPTVWQEPVFQALMDLVYRRGIAVGLVGTNGSEDLADPFEDTWVPVVVAAQHKAVTVPGLHKAIARGDVVARPQKPGGSRLEVSQRSLDHWTPDPVRQAARKQP